MDVTEEKWTSRLDVYTNTIQYTDIKSVLIRLMYRELDLFETKDKYIYFKITIYQCR